MTSKNEIELEPGVTEQRAWEFFIRIMIENDDGVDVVVKRLREWALETDKWKDTVDDMTISELVAAYSFAVVEDFQNIRDNGGL